MSSLQKLPAISPMALAPTKVQSTFRGAKRTIYKTQPLLFQFPSPKSHFHPTFPMEEISSSPGSRKRKQFQPSVPMKPCNRRITRSQITESPPQLVPESILKKPKTIHCPVLQDGASSELPVKDLRARRVFSPAVRDMRSNGLKEKMRNGSDLVSGSRMEMCASVKGGKEKSPNSERPNLGSKTKNEGENSGNGFISSTPTVRKSLSRGKVYQSPSSFSYRRMLPFLTDMVKEEPSTKTDIADKDRKVDDSINAGSHSSLVPTDSKLGQHTGEDSNGTSSLDSTPTQNSEIRQEVKAQGLYDSDKGMPQNVAKAGLLNVERIYDNSVTGVDEKIEDDIQTTPPDFNIFSKVDIYYTDMKGRDLFLDCQSNGGKCSNHAPSPTQRNNINSTTKQALNPCSQSKIYASSSSFSYRRLLPFLLDVEKGSANNDPSPQCQKQVESSSSSELFVSPDNKIEGCGFQENHQERCMELNLQPTINIPSLQCLKQIESSQSSQNSEIYVSSDSKNKSCSFQEKQLELNAQPSINAPSSQCQKQVESIQSSEVFVSLHNENEASGLQGNHLEKCMEMVVQPGIIDAASPQCLNPIESSQNSKLCVSSDSEKKACGFQENQQEKFVELNVQPSINAPSPLCQKLVESSQGFELYVQLDIENEACKLQENQLEKCIEVDVQDSINTPVDGPPHGVGMELSIPNKEMSPSKPNSDSSEDLTDPDVLITGKMSTPQKHAQLNEPRKIEREFHDAAGIKVRDAEVNQLVEAPLSRMCHLILPGESGLQFSYNQPVETLSICTTELVCDEGKLDRSKIDILDQGSQEFFYKGGNETHTKGILKRNPRGCRGLCSCLNCSSFRLHAERAFEFSRNQMLDAEDMVVMLINELGELRDSLEKSVADGCDPTDIQLKQIQVRETCKKALAMEQVVKQRLSQMSEDLNAHCRTPPLQRPGVTFSRHTEAIEVPDQNQVPGLVNPEKQGMVSLDALGSHEDGSFFKDQQL